MTDFQDILYGVDGPLGVITLNRPAYRNAQSYRMLDEIDQAFGLAKADDAVRVVIVRGAGATSVGRGCPTLARSLRGEGVLTFIFVLAAVAISTRLPIHFPHRLHKRPHLRGIFFPRRCLDSRSHIHSPWL